MSSKGRLLRGAKEIAGQIFGDEQKARAVYPIADDLPVFWLGGTLAAYSGALDEAMAAKERQGLRHKRRSAQRCPRLID